MKLLRLPKTALRMTVALAHDANRIRRLVSDPDLSRSYYPVEKRKSRIAVSMDLLRWRVRHGEVNSYYYFYGLDRTHAVDGDDYLPYNQFRRIRDQRNQHHRSSQGYSYICLLRDKFVFAQFLSSLGLPTPTNLALCTRNSITWLDGRGEVPLEALLRDPGFEIDAFCKNLTGMGGAGVFPLRISRKTVCQQERETALNRLQELDGAYLLQQRIQQHPEMSRLHPPSINAIRLVTFNNEGNVQAFWAALKIGSRGNRVDNVACGGLAVRIDLTSGRLKGEGMFLPGQGTTTARHPDTGVLFDDFEIPYFHEAVQCATDAHRHLYGIHSIGWDIAITPTGPTIIEGNDNWAGHFAMAFVPNFRSRFLAMYSVP